MPQHADETRAFVDRLNHGYERLHTAKEDAFWTAYMGLADDADAAQRDLDEKEIELNRFLADPAQLASVRAELARAERSARARPADEDLVALRGWELTFASHVIESAEARALAEDIVAAEGRLARARGKLSLAYTDASGERRGASSVELSVLLGSHADARVRRSAWEGLRSIEAHVLANGFLELVALRNRLGRLLGGEDYYDWKVRRVERMSKAEVFALLDDLEGRTREAARAAVAELARTKGGDATRPWNLRWHVAGDVTAEQDPYFPFGAALERWGRSFTALGIGYRGAELVLDLADRRGKYENGFMHGPVPAWRDRGTFRPARIHFTANAIPGMVGSGRSASETLFHEGGHAAHFANVDQPAPCFSQEFAPTSVAFSETQSMLLDSLLSDADWQARYARTTDGRAMPLALIEKGVRSAQPFAAWGLRAMVGVCQAEREIYELEERELEPGRVLSLLRDVERRHLFVADGAPRPILSIPHLLAGDSSAYYHGYVLAEMAVWQTREHFVARDGFLLDNPRLGPELRERYWLPGNGPSFGELIEGLVGAAPSAEALARHVERDLETALAAARADVRREPSLPRCDGPVALDATLRVVHGRETVAQVARDGDFEAAAARFAGWVDAQAAARGSA